MPTFPSSLEKGDLIGVIAPSSKWDTNTVKSTIQMIEQRGYKVALHPQTDLSNNQFAGTPQDKVNALHDYFTNPEIKAIFCLVGGNGALHILNQIDYTLIKNNPKIFMGFSDITALLNAITQETDLVTFHGPTLTNMGKLTPSDLDQCFTALETPQSILLNIESKAAGEGVLIGGNLSVLQALIGTDYAPNTNQDNILLIEDTNDHLSRYDRMIAHMSLAGWFKNTKAILLGEFLNTQDNPQRPFGFSIEDMLKAHAPDIPAIPNISVGHGKRLITLPIGAKAVLKSGTLSFNS